LPLFDEKLKGLSSFENGFEGDTNEDFVEVDSLDTSDLVSAENQNAGRFNVLL